MFSDATHGLVHGLVKSGKRVSDELGVENDISVNSGLVEVVSDALEETIKKKGAKNPHTKNLGRAPDLLVGPEDVIKAYRTATNPS